MEFVQSEHGKNKLILDGFVYVKQKNLANGVVSFECEKRRYTASCKAKVKILGQQVVGRLHDHTHAPDQARVEVLRAMQAMRHRAQQTQETPQQIITQSVGVISADAAAKLPTVHHLRRDIRRMRQRAQNPIPVPLTAQDLVIPDNLKTLPRGENFLLYDSGPANGRIILFGTQENISVLEHSSHWFLDGTFKTAPGIFAQLYTIHGLANDRTLPCVYCLLPDKSEATYMATLKQLIILNGNLHPTSIMVDFELAMINSLHRVFPQTTVKGCFFHFSQNIYRKIQEHGLQQRYQEEPEFALKMRMIAALAFITPQDVARVFEELSDFLPLEATPVIDYFEDTYIGRPQRRGRRPPLFAIDLWNMFERATNELPKTNNAVEGWHRSFSSTVGCSHPNIWNFIGFLQREQALQEVYIAQALAGHAPQPARKKYVDLQSRILAVVADRNNRAALDYLRGIAHNLNF